LVCTLAPTKPEVLWIAVSQNLAFSALLATVLMYFHKKWLPFKYIHMVAIILPLIPSFGFHTIIIGCDLPCAMAILWFTYVLVRIIDEMLLSKSASQKQQISFAVQLGLSLVLIFFLRANSFLVYLVMAPVLTLLFLLKRQWKLLIAVALSVVLVLLIRFPGYDALNVQTGWRSTNMKYSAAVHDIQATYYKGGELSERTLSKLREYATNLDAEWARDYFVPAWVAYSEYGYGAIELSASDIIPMYADSFVRNPLLMLESVLHRTRPYWVIDHRNEVLLINYYAIWSPVDNDNENAPQIGVYRHSNFVTQIMRLYTNAMALPLPSIFIWRFGIWTALMVVSAMTLLWQRRYIWLLAYLPVLTYLASLCLAVGWLDYRYGLPVFFTGLFLPPLFVLSSPPAENKEPADGEG
jgi:hypothetical protein